MSRTFSICCDLCRTAMWIGQGPITPPRTWALYVDPPHLWAFERFMLAHVGHPMVFGDDEALREGYDPTDHDPVEILADTLSPEPYGPDLQAIAEVMGAANGRCPFGKHGLRVLIRLSDRTRVVVDAACCDRVRDAFTPLIGNAR